MILNAVTDRNWLLEASAFVTAERLDVEDLIISHLIQAPDRIIEVSEYFNPKCLEVTANRVAYLALIEMALADLPIDPVQLEVYLDRQGKLNIVGGAIQIAVWAGGSILAPNPSQQSIDSAIDYLLEIYKRKALLRSIESLKAKLLDLNFTYVEVAQFAETCLLDFLKGKKESVGLEPVSTTISDSIELILKRSIDKQAGNPSEAISTGFVDLDNLTGGWQRSDLIIVAGRTSMSKSAFLQNTCLSIARTMPVALFSLEMSTQQMNERFISIETGIDASKIRDGNLEQSDHDRLFIAGERLRQLKYWGCDGARPSMDFIASECRKLAARQGRLGGIAIDHVGLMIENHENPRADINRITSHCKQLAMELDCPLFLVSQINRGCENRNEKRPQLADLAESGRLEQDANVVVMLYRDEYYNPDSREKGIAEVIIRKNRGGECGTSKLVYEGRTTTFKNYVGF